MPCKEAIQVCKAEFQFSRGGNLGRSPSILLYFISNFIPDEGIFGILNGFQGVLNGLQTSISFRKLPWGYNTLGGA